MTVWRRSTKRHADEDEPALVAAAQRDPRAFAPLYERYFDPIYRYALHRLGDPERAADATSQVFVRALSALSAYRPGSFRSWLFTIAHNVVIDAAQRAKPEYVLTEGWDQRDPSPTPEESLLRREAQRRLSHLLQTLTPEQREVVELHLAGFTSHEIADHLGRGLAATRSLQWRAFARLKRVVANESPIDSRPPDALPSLRKEHDRAVH